VLVWDECCCKYPLQLFTYSSQDACFNYAWTAYGLIIWLAWVGISCGKKEAVLEAKYQMIDRLNCDEVGEMQENIG
jgi:hypothetical protein